MRAHSFLHLRFPTRYMSRIAAIIADKANDRCILDFHDRDGRSIPNYDNEIYT
jgi:hypothetical protein